jgi:hypothetical protein
MADVTGRRQQRDHLRSVFFAAEAKLASWDKALNDPEKFKPVIKCEWDRAFDVRERAAKRYYEAYPISYCKDRPNSWMAVSYLLPDDVAKALADCETDSDIRRVLGFREDFPGDL